MSVSFFSAKELGNLARCCAPGYSSYERHVFEKICDALAIFSLANAEACDYNYPNSPKSHPVDATTIARSAPSALDANLERALSSAQLLDYNLVANDGREFGDVTTLRAVNSVVTSILRRVAARAGFEQ